VRGLYRADVMKILAIAAHADDAEIACGGTLAKAVAHGHQVRLLVLTHSAFGNYDGEVRRTREQVIQEGMAAAEVLGGFEIELLDFPTKELSHGPEVVEAIERRLDAMKPDLILTHWPHDTHQDHRAAALATLSAARWYRSIAMYEPMTPAGRSYEGFRPQLYIDISSHAEVKEASLRAHTSQVQKFGPKWLEAIDARARVRGYEVGVSHAEAFEVVRFELEIPRLQPE